MAARTIILAAGAALPALAFTAPGAWAQQAPAVIEVTTGHAVAMTPPDALDCDALALKLAEIDATGYRGAKPRPAHDEDMPLFDYENRVSNRYYADCVAMRSAGESDGRSIFDGGFGGPASRREPPRETSPDR
ncbi:MAG: hypothetical protein AAFU61_04270 [Pseudomonadota bacterium]